MMNIQCLEKSFIEVNVGGIPSHITQGMSNVLVFMPLKALSFYWREEPCQIWNRSTTHLGPFCL